MRESIPRRLAWTLGLLAVALVALPMSAGAANSQPYVVHRLVSNGGVPAAHTDAQLENGWGLAARPTSPWWVADNGTNVSTLYDSNGNKQSLVVTVDGAPTGEVANLTSGFVVGTGATARSALFIWAGEDGKIRGWNPTASPTTALVAVDNSADDTIYKGLAIATGPAGPELYATDFHHAKVDVYDGSWSQVNTPGAFVDPKLPNHYAPFGIQAIQSAGTTRIFVTYAKQDKAAEDERAGDGLGIVDVYDTAGTFLGRVAKHDDLNAPWGLALAPAGFGPFAGDLLVGNFGDGRINAYEEQANGEFEHRGQLRDENGKQIVIDGLWALEFGNAGSNGTPNMLFFTAGPNDEHDGLFGSITAD
jgi:uncharacterized protein (TIGR03118 family)